MRKMDVLNYTLAGVLLAASVPLYRLILERQRALPEKPTVLQPAPADAVRELQDAQARAALAASIRVQTSVECRNGVLIHRTADGRDLTIYEHGRQSRCEIRAEPARPQDFEATEQTP